MAHVRPAHREDRDAAGEILRFSVWSPRNPIAIAQISGGRDDHSARDEALAQFLVARGFAVYAEDHSGSVDSINRLTAIAREEHPGRPLGFIGHSWGSLLGQIALDRGTLAADFVVFSGTALRTPFTMKWFRVGLSMFGFPRRVRWHTPILVVQEPVNDLGNERSVIALADRYVRAGYDDVTLIVHDSRRRDGDSVSVRDAVLADLGPWLDERMERFGR